MMVVEGTVSLIRDLAKCLLRGYLWATIVWAVLGNWYELKGFVLVDKNTHKSIRKFGKGMWRGHGLATTRLGLGDFDVRLD